MRLTTLATSLLALSLAACSGGGGSSPTPQVAISAPSAAPSATIVPSAAPSTPSPAPTLSATATPTITVLGDSICAGYITTAPLAYVDDPMKAWPAVVGQLTGDNVTNLCIPGAGISPGDAVAEQYEVPAIPKNTTFLIYANGMNDFGTERQTWQQEKWTLDALLPTLRAAAPQATLVFVGVRSVTWLGNMTFADFAAFNTYLASIPNSLYVDDASGTDPGSYWYVPSEWDSGGVHPTLAAVAKIAKAVAAVIH